MLSSFAAPLDGDRADATCFFSPRGRSPRQRDEGARVDVFGEGSPSIRPFGPPSPPRGEETGGTLSFLIEMKA
ncbi:hypothetical protein AGR7B_Cc30037 [Agrobacterium deltaense RV3]|nr:hypothetical protein AGR7B_Cc30037 [Agrobacterium deltaense RV3]